jgi:hypothetical protein
MTENTLQWIAFLKLISVAIYSLFYGFGGISGKWKRRYIGSAYLTLLIVGFSVWMQTFSWYYLLTFPLLVASTSIGYGADTTMEKVVKRSYCGLAYAFSTVPVFIVKMNWELFILHILLCLITSIVLGVRNPFDNARAEESAIGFMIGFLPILAI